MLQPRWADVRFGSLADIARSRHVQRTARVRQGPKAEVISRSVGLANWSLAITLPGF